MSRVEASKYVPDDAQGSAPMPAGKRINVIQDVIPACDEGRARVEGGLISFEDYEALMCEGKG